MAIGLLKQCDICKADFREWRHEANQNKEPVLVVPIQIEDKSHRLVIQVSYQNSKEDICKDCFTKAIKDWLNTNKS